MDYLCVYLATGFTGWILENVYNKNKTPMCADTLNRKYLNLCMPFLHLWGVGGIVLLYVIKNFNHINVYVLSLVAGLLLTILEAVAGLLSYKINGYQTWNYNDHICPMVGGYIAADVSCIWIFGALLFFIVHRNFLICIK